MLTDIDIENINDEIIQKVLFTTPNSEYTDADCLIVFGCHIKPLLEERVETAVNILQEKNIGKILVTGGVGVNGDFNESKYMKEILLNYGFNENMILVENQSTTTEENVINSIEILKTNSLIYNKRIVLVSSQAHLRRIGMEFKKQLKNVDFEIIYEYPNPSVFSLDNVLKSNELVLMATNEIKKIIKFINMGIIENESIVFGSNMKSKEKLNMINKDEKI